MSEGERQRLVSYVVRCGTRTQLDLGGWTCCCVLLFIVFLCVAVHSCFIVAVCRPTMRCVRLYWHFLIDLPVVLLLPTASGSGATNR